MEHIIRRHLLDHLDKHNVLTSLNHGFRAGYSCEMQLVVTAHDLLESFDSDTQADVLVLNFSKAFDTVTHQNFYQNLRYMAYTDQFSTGLQTFLLSAKLVLLSRANHVESGVPQATVLCGSIIVSLPYKRHARMCSITNKTICRRLFT